MQKKVVPITNEEYNTGKYAHTSLAAGGKRTAVIWCNDNGDIIPEETYSQTWMRENKIGKYAQKSSPKSSGGGGVFGSSRNEPTRHVASYSSSSSSADLQRNRAEEKRIEAEIEMKRKAQEAELERQRLEEEKKKLQKYTQIAQAGTAAAYMQVHKAGKSFGAERLLPVQVNQILSSFPYDKVPGEFSKIVVYHKNAMNNAGFMEKILTVVESFSVAGDESLEHLKSVAEMNPDNAEMAAALPEINELLQALKSKRKKALMIAGAVLVFTILLAAIAR